MKLNKAIGSQVQKNGNSKVNKLIPILTALAFVIGLQTATQSFAYKFNYHTSLEGQISHHVYVPWAIIKWSAKWYSQHPDEFMKAGNVGILATAIVLFFLTALKFITTNNLNTKEYILNGSARWANKKDIQHAGLLTRPSNALEILMGKKTPAAAGVYVGGWEDKNGKFHYLRSNGPEHILTIAPTRSGKRVGLIIPTLLSWSESAIITDLKGELWQLTAGWRKKHAKNKALRFEPASSNSVCWNPLDEVRIGTENEFGDVQNLASLILDPEGKGLEQQGLKTAFTFLVDVILFALHNARKKGLPISLGSISSILEEMIHYGHYDNASSVLSTVKSYLALYRDPVIAKNTNKSEFRIKDLMNHDTPVSLYIIIHPNDRIRLQPLVCILINMIIRLSSDKIEFEQINSQKSSFFKHILRKKNEHTPTKIKKTYKHRLLVMLDDFPSLGKLISLEESLCYSAEYGIKFHLLCKDLKQLKSRETGYGPDEIITSNCHIKNAFPPNHLETAEYLASLTGQTTLLKEHITTVGKRTAIFHSYVSRSYHEIQRNLLTADELLRIPSSRKNNAGEIKEAGDMIIYVSGYPAIYGKQPLFFKDPIFQARATISAPHASDTLDQWEQKIPNERNVNYDIMIKKS